MIVDVIVLSKTTSDLETMTRQCIASLRGSEPGHQFNVILVESMPERVDVGQDETILWGNKPFNYNAAMNLGLKRVSSDWVVMANNDLIFHPGWFTEICKVHDKYPDIESFSSWTYYRRWHERFFQDENALGVRTVIAEDALDRVRSAVAAVGYISIGELAGWCLTVRGGLLSKITLHEYVDFYYSDRVYADELLRIGMRHALVVNSRVDHLAHVTLDKEPGIRGLINEGQEPKYRAAISEEVEDRWQRYLERRARGPELLY